MKTINGKIYQEEAAHDFTELKEIVSILRSPQGCPWDREQTHESLIPCLRDESEEVVEAIQKNDMPNLCEELGDVLLQILLHCEIAKEKGEFTFEDVVQGLSEKMIRRHPHVFGEEELLHNSEDTLKLWAKIKEKEKQKKEQD